MESYFLSLFVTLTSSTAAKMQMFGVAMEDSLLCLKILCLKNPVTQGAIDSDLSGREVGWCQDGGPWFGIVPSARLAGCQGCLPLCL